MNKQLPCAFNHRRYCWRTRLLVLPFDADSYVLDMYVQARFDCTQHGSTGCFDCNWFATGAVLMLETDEYVFFELGVLWIAFAIFIVS